MVQASALTNDRQPIFYVAESKMLISYNRRPRLPRGGLDFINLSRLCRGKRGAILATGHNEALFVLAGASVLMVCVAPLANHCLRAKG